MDDMKEKKTHTRQEIAKKLNALSKGERLGKNTNLVKRLFDFANFLEARIVLLYTSYDNEVDTQDIIKTSCDYHKIIVLPAFDPEKYAFKFMKVDNTETDLKLGPRGNLEPNPSRCKAVPLDCLDIAIIPGIAFDEKGGRLGTGKGYYDKMIPKLPITTRKVAIAYEEQIISHVPMESHDKHVDIIVTDKRVIYKI